MTTFLWIGDALLILGVFPVLVLLLLRIIGRLLAAHRALVSISGSARAATASLPPAMTEISSMAHTANKLRPHNAHVAAR